VPADDDVRLLAQPKARLGPHAALALVDAPGLLLGLVHRQLEAARGDPVVDACGSCCFDECGSGLHR